MPESLTFCGHTFGRNELELMRRIAAEFSALGVTEIARTVCELLEWKRPSGGLKNHECRLLLEQLQAEGFLKLPDLQKLGGRGPRRPDVSAPCPEPEPVECAASECEPLELTQVEGRAESLRWRATSNMSGSGCSPFCTVSVWMPPTMRRNELFAAW